MAHKNIVGVLNCLDSYMNVICLIYLILLFLIGVPGASFQHTNLHVIVWSLNVRDDCKMHAASH